MSPANDCREFRGKLGRRYAVLMELIADHLGYSRNRHSEFLGDYALRQITKRCATRQEKNMTRDLVLWFAGVPIVVIVGLHLFGVL